MGNIFSQKVLERKQYDNWDHYAVNGQTLSQINETMKQHNVNFYKYRSLKFGSYPEGTKDSTTYYVAFPDNVNFRTLSPSWSPTTAQLCWFLKNGNVYTDVYIDSKN